MDILAFIDIPVWIYVALTAATTAASFAAQQAAAEQQEDIGNAQRRAAEAAARNEELTAAENIRRARENKRRKLARLRTDLAQSGIVMGDSLESSFLESAASLELEIQDAARQSSVTSANIRSQGQMSLWESRQQAAATRISSWGSLLEGGARVYGQIGKAQAAKAAKTAIA